jgi:outer membrane immunogenic protein
MVPSVAEMNYCEGWLMKRILIGSAALTLFTVTGALAADLPAKAPIYKAPAAIVWDWTGFYVGGNVGYSWAKWGNSGLASNASPSVNGALGGLQAGYNWQVNPTWVVGLEGDIQITGERASEGANIITTDVPGGPPPFIDPAAYHTITTTTFTNQWKFPWFGTFRGRIGGLVDPTTLIYATGGLAVGNFKFSSQSTSMAQSFRGAVGTTTNPLVGTATTAVAALSESTTQAGWAIGAGVEKKFTPNWSGKLEYLYLDFGKHTFLSGTAFATQTRLHDNIVRVGLNYAFNK